MASLPAQLAAAQARESSLVPRTRVGSTARQGRGSAVRYLLPPPGPGARSTPRLAPDWPPCLSHCRIHPPCTSGGSLKCTHQSMALPSGLLLDVIKPSSSPSLQDPTLSGQFLSNLSPYTSPSLTRPCPQPWPGECCLGTGSFQPSRSQLQVRPVSSQAILITQLIWGMDLFSRSLAVSPPRIYLGPPCSSRRGPGT